MIKICMALAFLLVLGAILVTVRDREQGRQENVRQAQELEGAVAALGEAERTHQRNLAKWYNYQLEQGTLENPGVYQEILDLGGGKMALLEVPELELKLPVFHDGGGVVSHDTKTPLPLGGRGEHTVLALCQSYYWEPGMAVYIDCLGKRLTYRVESVQVMVAGWPTERPWTADQTLLTLVYDRGDTRTLIRCVRCEALLLREGDDSPELRWLMYGLPLLLLFYPLRRKKAFPFRRQNLQSGGFYPESGAKPKLF